MNLIIILVLLLYIYFTATGKGRVSNKETLTNVIDDSYYIDSSGEKHIIKTLPVQLNDITELKYTTTSSSHVKFVSTKGNYNTISSENRLDIINNKPKIYQSFHIYNTETPFSGTLF
jgi:hypothetical protein